MAEVLPFATRLWLALSCFVRLIADGRFAARVAEVRDGEPAALPPAEPAAADATPALQLLSLFQREGRLIDFLEQDIADFSDADVGAAARVVHEGCRKTLRAHCRLGPVRSEAEESQVTVPAGYDAAAIKLTGAVKGAAPYRGTLRHRGWRIDELELPTTLAGHDAAVVAPAEVEVG